MFFIHSEDVWRQFPALRALVIVVRDGRQARRAGAAASLVVQNAAAQVDAMLAESNEGELAPVKSWREAYSAMGLKPTQYRCASEALLRRYRKDRSLPQFHPLVDVLNVESMRSAIPIAAFDAERIGGGITVRPALGHEEYTSFQGEVEHPEEGEIIFADQANQAHSRRWVFRQSAHSVVRDSSDVILIVCEALHPSAAEDLAALDRQLSTRFADLGVSRSDTAILTPTHCRFEFTA